MKSAPSNTKISNASLYIIYNIYILLLLLLYIGTYTHTLHYRGGKFAWSNRPFGTHFSKKGKCRFKSDPKLFKVTPKNRALLAVETPCHMAPTS